jgi:broad specificity phosphatase PhoE
MLAPGRSFAVASAVLSYIGNAAGKSKNGAPRGIMILIRHGQSLFNAAYNRTRIDPGIPDPGLTDAGRAQIAATAEALIGVGLRLVVASPYTRAIETAAILAERLDLPIAIEPLVRERAAFTCDIGSPRAALERRWPGLDFGALEDEWWHRGEEPEDMLLRRCHGFRGLMRGRADWPFVAIVSHWAFIRGLTGHELQNGQFLRFDPAAGPGTGPGAAIVAAGPDVLSSAAHEGSKP